MSLQTWRAIAATIVAISMLFCGISPAFAAPVDSLSGVVAAFGLRLLRTGYSGAAIQVRRSSDNVVQDIGFTAGGDLDTAALLAFVGSNTARVAIWYDQSGQGNNATQTNTSLQPTIVNSGSLVTQNGRPAIVSTSATQQLIVATGSILGQNGTTTTENYVNAVASLSSNSGHVLVSNDQPGLYGHGIGNNASGSTQFLAMYNRAFQISRTGTFPLGQLLVADAVFSTTTGNKAWINGTTVWTAGLDTGNGGHNTGQATLFSCQPGGTGAYCNGSGDKYIAEVIVTKNATMSDSARTTLVSNQVGYFSISGSPVSYSVSVTTTTESIPISDPTNGTTNPKFIPQSISQLKLVISNNSLSPDYNSFKLMVSFDANTDVYTGNLQSGRPYIYSNGTPSCSLTPGTMSYLDANGNTISPTPDADGYASQVSKVQIAFSGLLAANSGTAPNCTVTLQQRVR